MQTPATTPTLANLNVQQTPFSTALGLPEFECPYDRNCKVPSGLQPES